MMSGNTTMNTYAKKTLDHHPFEIPVTMHYMQWYLKPEDHILMWPVERDELQEYYWNKGFIWG